MNSHIGKLKPLVSFSRPRRKEYFGNLLLVGINYDKDAKGANAKRHSCLIEKV